jgi:outer membrane beta-barrel protein
MYFAFGGGTSSTNSQEKSVPALHVGTGQIFALTKSMAFRWDYSWNFYQATPVSDAASTSAPSKSNYNDLVFTAGVSFFFPEANYR